MPKVVIAGRFGRPHGVRGWIKVNSFTNPKENILDFTPWLLQKNNGWNPIIVESSRFSNGTVFVKLAACDTPEAAQAYTNVEIAVERSQLPELQSDNYYWADLEGLTVKNLEGISFGVVERLLETGANDVLVVQGEQRRLIPYISQVIKKVDLQEKIIIVDWNEDY